MTTLDRLDSLSLLSTSSRSSSTPPQGSSSQQQTFSDQAPSTSDLCSLSSLLVVSVPGLHFSDLARLPLSSSSPNGISSSLAQAESTTTQPYVREHTLSQPLKLVRRFERECGAVFESQHEKNLWSGDREAKTIRIVQIDGLKDYELNSEGAESGRKQVMENAGKFFDIQDSLDSFSNATDFPDCSDRCRCCCLLPPRKPRISSRRHRHRSSRFLLFSPTSQHETTSSPPQQPEQEELETTNARTRFHC